MSAKSGRSESFPVLFRGRRIETLDHDAVGNLRTVSIHGSSGKKD